mmetsp:Transcript_48572/g.77286  ORF Transcript_48572/g.77286 Transcript_48572/m.77286 type:complete len:339 (+) Transcript_48572:60-1076(+)
MPSTRQRQSPLALSKVAVLTLLLLGVPQCVVDLTDYVSESSPADCKRDLWCVDLFSGCGSLSSHWRESNFKSASFDVCSNAQHDLTTPLGFMLAIRLVLRLRPRGLLSLGPPCGSFVWVNLATSLRTLSEPYGDVTKSHVSLGNLLMARACILCLIATVRGCFWLLEQPYTSMAKVFPPLRKTVMDIDRYILPCHWRVFFWMGSWGHNSMKPSAAWGTMPSIGRLYRRMNKKRRASLCSRGMVRKGINKQGKRVVTGGPKLKESAAYPKGYGARLLDLHKPIMVNNGFLKGYLHRAVDNMLKDGVRVPANNVWDAADLPSMQQTLRKLAKDDCFHKIR